ncbi:MAG: hypothetical protein V5A28_15145 [Haloarculaceae archaeon]
MGRLRAFGYSVVVAGTVFLYLALPTLRTLYGPVANIPVYALVALVAGGITWLFLVDRPGETPTAAGPGPRRDVEDDPDDDEAVEDEEVENELASLREEV